MLEVFDYPKKLVFLLSPAKLQANKSPCDIAFF